MKLQDGVDLHFIPTERFTTNIIKMRFAAPMREETVAGRVLLANILEIANADFPTAQLFRRRLAQLYGANFSTSVLRRGQTHIVDINISYIRESNLLEKELLTQELLDFLASALYRPLVHKKAFDQQLFDIEKKNLLSFLESEVEDNFYHADLELNSLFYKQDNMKIPRVGRKDLVEKETAATVYKAYRDMLSLDKIDIFVMGQVDQEEVKQRFLAFDFSYRNPKLSLDYGQEFSNITREKVERKEAKQSILQLAYNLQVRYSDVNYPALIVFNGIFGGFAHSKLFVNVREREGLAYTIGSSVHIFSGLLRVYAGIDKKNRLQTIQLIRKQLSDMKSGQFTDEDLELTKKMLVHSASLSQDRPASLIEEKYNRTIYGEAVPSFEKWIDSVNLVSREEVIAVSKLLKLEALYFMEGTQ